MRLVDIDLLPKVLIGIDTNFMEGIRYMREMLNRLPAVEVVLCGECVHFEEDPNEEDGAFWCEYSGAGKITRCDYCSKGIRKRENDG